MKTTVAIIGAARPEGQALAHNLADAGFPLRLMCSQREDLVELTAELKKKHPGADIEFLFGERDATWEADVIIPAAPYALFNTVSENIRDVITGKVLLVIPDKLFLKQTGEKNTEADVEAFVSRTFPYTRLVNAETEDGISTIKDEFMVEDVRKIIGNIDLNRIGNP